MNKDKVFSLAFLSVVRKYAKCIAVRNVVRAENKQTHSHTHIGVTKQ